MDEIELIEDYPSKIAAMLINNEVDVGLIPVAACLKLNQWNIIGTHCIGSDGPVASVCIFSEQPIDEVRKVYLDYQSRTSVNLAKLLLNEYWKLKVEYIDAKGEDFRNEIKGNTAGVIGQVSAVAREVARPLHVRGVHVRREIGGTPSGDVVEVDVGREGGTRRTLAEERESEGRAVPQAHLRRGFGLGASRQGECDRGEQPGGVREA